MRDEQTKIDDRDAARAELNRLRLPLGAVGYGFGWALEQLRSGGRVTRLGWNGFGQHLTLQVLNLDSKMTLPYIYITTVQGDLVPWVASQTDLLATDWREVVDQVVTTIVPMKDAVAGTASPSMGRTDREF